MPAKMCQGCGAAYWARWRNEPAALCPSCRATALVCVDCGVVVAAPPDIEQLEFFPWIIWQRPSRVETPTIEERYWSLRAKATQATRRRYPYC